MLRFFRSLIHSKVGALVGLAVLVVIALAFAAGDISGSRNMGGPSGGSLANVGGEEITAADLNREANNALQRVRQSEPTMSMKALIARGGFKIVLDDMIDLAALTAFGKDNKVVAGDRLIDSELQRAGATQANAIPRNSVAQRLIARQLLSPAEYGAVLPREMAWRYSQLLAERRSGSVVVLPSLAFAPEKAPSMGELSAFYRAHTSAFIRPERRVVRYAVFGADALKNVPAPSDAEVARRYQADQAKYAALEQRRITQLIVPTEAAGKAIIGEVAGGKSLDASASQKGLAAAKLGPLSKQALAAQSSGAVADAVFATPAGKMAPLARSPLGWHVIQVEAIDNRPGRTLDQAKGEIAAAIATEKRRAALSDYLARIEQQFEDGSNLPEVAKGLGLEVKTTAPITADGRVYGNPAEMLDPRLRPVLQTAFSMQEEEPQVAEAEAGTTFVLYDVTAIAPSAPAPFKDIVGDVKVAYAREKGSQAAKAQAQQIQAALKKGEKLEAVLARVGKKLPPVEQVAMTRPELTRIQQSGRQVPPPIRLMFAMAARTAKVQQAPEQRGWFVVVLNQIEPGKLAPNDQTVRVAQRDLGKVAGTEYSEALRKAITAEVGVKRNEAAIRALRDELAGTASTGG